MRIARIVAHNFRSICDVDIVVGPLLVLVGPNNHGKSNILGAVEFALGGAIKLAPDDFCAFRLVGDNSLWVELTFDSLTEQERRTWTKYVDSQDQVTIRREATLTDAGEIEIGYHGYFEEPELWWLRETAYERLQTRDAITAESQQVPELRALLEDSGRITKPRVRAFQEEYIAEHRDELVFERVIETGPLMGTRNVAAGILPDFYLIPAVRELADETKLKGTTAFGRLVQRALTEMAAGDPRVAELRARIASLAEDINDRSVPDGAEPSALARLEHALASELSQWDVKVGIRLVPPELDKLFELGTELRIDDGHDTLAERKGHGLQRATLFGLVRAWAASIRRTSGESGTVARKASESVIFAIEEPELFLHPQAQRILNRSLRDLASTEQHQVMLCTHSAQFINMEDYQSIVIATKRNAEEGTRVRQCRVDLFAGSTDLDAKHRFQMAYWVNPDRGELFFAQKVVLVEGATEAMVLPFIAERIGVFNETISILDCGSKHNLPLYQAILNAFQIPYCVIHDEDPVPAPPPEEWSTDKVKSKQKTFALNKAIDELAQSPCAMVEVFSPDFETACGVSRSQGDKMGKPLAALEHLSQLSDDQLPSRLVQVVRAAYFVPAQAQLIAEIGAIQSTELGGQSAASTVQPG